MISTRLISLALLCCGLLTGLHAQTLPGQDGVWFDQVTTPSQIPPANIEDFCRQLHQAIASGQGEKQLAALAPAEPSPRILFVSLGCDLWPARTYFGSGWSFADAWQNTASIMLANEQAYAAETAKQARGNIDSAKREAKPTPKDWVAREKTPGAWNWLRLDIVQVARPSFDYSVEGSKIGLTSLVGLAFGPQVGFAFPPAQLTGRCLITPNRFLAKQQVANIIAETYNWGAMKNWLRLSAVDTGHRICLFETDSYCTDGKQVVRLYRGHPVAKLPDNDQCLEAAARCGELLLANLDKAKGTLSPPFPEWVSSDTSAERPDTQAELVIALARLAQASKQAQFANGAALAAKPIKATMMRYGQNKDHIAVIEKEELPPGSLLEPRRITSLRSNAIACIAFLELAAVFPDDPDYPAIATAMGKHLQRQAQPGNGFVFSKLFPSDQLYDDNTLSDYGQTEATALATLALAKLGKINNNTDFLAVADDNHAFLLKARLEKQDLTSIVSSPWLAEALSQYYRRNTDFVTQLTRLAFAATVEQNNDPIFPDLFGSVENWESMTTAAERTWLLATISRTFRNSDQAAKAADVIATAAPYLCFQYQARIDRASAAALSRPRYYVDFFRDHLEDFGFDLNGQATQIISLLAVRQELMEGFDGQFPKIDQFQTKLAAAQKAIDTHPLPLSVELVIHRGSGENSDGRDLLGEIPKRGAVNFRGKGGKIVPVKDEISAGVLKKKRRNTKTPPAQPPR